MSLWNFLHSNGGGGVILITIDQTVREKLYSARLNWKDDSISRLFLDVLVFVRFYSPETNIGSEHRPLETEIPIEDNHF